MTLKDIDMINHLIKKRLDLNVDLAALHATEFNIGDDLKISVFKNVGGIKYNTSIKDVDVSRFEVTYLFKIMDTKIRKEIERINEQLIDLGFEEEML